MADVNKTVQINIKGDASKLNKSLDKAKSGLASLAKGAAIGTAAIAGFAAAFVKLNQAIADNINELADASVKTGIAVGTLQALRLAAEGSGRSFSAMEGGLIRFQQSMEMASTGTGKQAEAFDKLGISVNNTDGSLRSSNDVFDEAIGKLSEMEAGTEKNTTTMALFGRTSGAALLQSGAIDAMQLFNDKVQRFGVDTGPKAREEAARFQRAMADLGMITARAGQDMAKAISGKNSPASALEMLGGALVFVKSIANDVFTFIADSLRVAFGGIQAMFHGITSLDFGAIGSKVNKILTAKSIKDMSSAYSELQKETQKANTTVNQLMKPLDKALNVSIGNMSDLFGRASAEYSSFMSMTNISGSGGTGSPAGGRGGRRRSGAAAGQKKELVDLIKLQEEVDKIVDRSNDKVISKSEKIRKEYKEQIERLQEIKTLSKDKIDIDEAAFELEKDMISQLAELKQKERDKEKKEQEAAAKEEKRIFNERINRVSTYGKAITNYFSSFGAAIKTTMENSGDLTEEQARKLHRLQQMAGVADVWINAAVATMKGYAQFGPVGGSIAAGLMSALATAQTAAILSQPPPKFHTGGMVDGADVVNAQLLRGEAVLSRKQVRAIGGADGVQQIGNAPQIIITNSFKHFDRYVASSMRGNSRIRKLIPASNGRRL